MKIRPAFPSDDLVAIWREVYRADYVTLLPAGVDLLFEPRGDAWIADADGAVAGFAYVDGEWLDELWVRKPFWGHGMGSAQTMKFTNDSMADFAQTMQLMVDRPVIDQTNLSGRYDFTLLWTPDTLRAAEPDAPPGLFTAVQEQLGLKLEATRAPTDVFVIDAATRPTQN